MRVVYMQRHMQMAQSASSRLLCDEVLTPCLRRMVLTREHAMLAVNDTEVAERFRLYCLPTFREGWCAF